MTISPDTLLAWKIQINEYLKALSAPPTNRLAEHDMLTSKIDGTIYKISKVDGDGDCFFNSVNDPKITRNNLVSKLLSRANESEIRTCFALEIRQFLFLGLANSHQGLQEQQAYNKFKTEEFRNLNQRLDEHENQLRVNLQPVIDSYPDAEGKTHEQLMGLFERNNERAVLKLKETCQKVNQLGQEILKYCTKADTFKNYVTFYLQDARGFIPFSRRLTGEDVKTPIDAINFIFNTNIQVFLNTGERLIAGSGTPPIPILFNGRDHFDGLDPQSREEFLTFDRVIDQMPSCEKPNLYPMAHLLQAGFRGTHYQLLVLLHKVTQLMSLGHPFEAMFEAKSYGIADDVVINSKNQNGQTTIQGFQAKCYTCLIEVGAFFNEKTNEKQKKQSKMHIGKFFKGWEALKNKKCQQATIIVYTNTDVDDTLKKCINKNRFSTSFIKQRKKVTVTVNKKKQDLFDVLYKQSKSYCGKKILKGTFREFLESFQFSLNQKDIQPLSDSIIVNLKNIKKDWKGRFDQLFINLYYTTTEWFIHDHIGQRQTPCLTNEVLTQFIDQSRVRSETTIKLQTITGETLKQIGSTTATKIHRNERKQLEKALQGDKNLTVVSGDKGIGKSFLIKEFLSDYEPDRYLFLSTKEVVNDKNLQNEVLDVLKHSPRIFVCVLDAAEALLSLRPLEMNRLITSLTDTKRRIILTLPTADLPTLNIDTRHSDVILKPLNPKDVSKKHPKLQSYIQQNPTLFGIPFYLNIMVQLLKRSGSKAPDHFNHLFDKDIKMKLIKEAIAGADPKLKKQRVKEWRKLASSLATGTKDSKLASVDPSLEKNGIVLEKQFTHDLFFEYGLMSFWTRIKEGAKTPIEFWGNLPEFLKFDNPIPVLAEWIKNQSLQKEIADSAEALSSKDVFKSLIAAAIVMKDRDFLNKLLRYRHSEAYDTSHKDNDILLAITVDSPHALEALLKAEKNPPKPDLTNFKSLEEELSDSSEMSVCKSESTMSDDETDGSSNYGSDMDICSNRSSPDGEDYEFSENDSYSSYPDVPSNCEIFCQSGKKYWCAGFNKEPGWEDYDGLWINNPNYQPPPDNLGLPMFLALQMDRMECLKLLTKDSTFLSEHNSYQESALHFAALRGSDQAMQILIGLFSDINIQDEWGEAPLHNAAYNQRIETTELLLKGGANPNLLSKLGLSPLHIAMGHLSFELVKLLLQHEGNLSIAPFKPDEEITVADLLDHLPDYLQDEMENFVIDLINYLLPNRDGQGWTKDVIEDLETLVEHRAQVSNDLPIFDYTDTDSEIDYMLNSDPGKLDSLIDEILADPERLNRVLNSETFKSVQMQLVKDWVEEADDRGLKNIEAYANEYSDDAVQGYLLDNITMECLPNFGPTQLISRAHSILAHPDRINQAVNSVYLHFDPKAREEYVKDLIQEASDNEFENIVKDADDNSDEDIKDALVDHAIQYDQKKIDCLTHIILADLDRIDRVINSDFFKHREKDKKDLVAEWVLFASEEQLENIKDYADWRSDKTFKYYLEDLDEEDHVSSDEIDDMSC